MKKSLVTLIALFFVIGAGALWAQSDETAVATFAGGCFWCMEPPYDEVDGVISTTVGFSGGDVENPSYRQVVRGGTGHHEAVRIEYDPNEVDYETLLVLFWHNIDPFDGGGQFCDRGSAYLTAVFYHNDEQRRLAEETKAELEERFDREIATEIEPAMEFYVAEGYHQNYYQKNPTDYQLYYRACGRERRLVRVWGNKAQEAGEL
jgi:peptide-methionine (S)-S-oxide reductase